MGHQFSEIKFQARIHQKLSPRELGLFLTLVLEFTNQYWNHGFWKSKIHDFALYIEHGFSVWLWPKVF